VWAHVKLAQISLFDHTVPAPQQRTMTEQEYGKRRKIAKTSLTVNLFVPDKEAHRVDNETFREWNKEVVKILEDAEKQVEVVNAKFVKTSGAKGMQAPCDAYNWRQLRHDQNAQ
jgi:predicted HAD superfamily phosphohydrolase